MKNVLVITLFIPLFSFSSDTDLKITPVLESDQTIGLSIEQTSKYSSKKDKKFPVVSDTQLLVVSGLVKDQHSDSFPDRALEDKNMRRFLENRGQNWVPCMHTHRHHAYLENFVKKTARK